MFLFISRQKSLLDILDATYDSVYIYIFQTVGYFFSSSRKREVWKTRRSLLHTSVYIDKEQKKRPICNFSSLYTSRKVDSIFFNSRRCEQGQEEKKGKKRNRSKKKKKVFFHSAGGCRATVSKYWGKKRSCVRFYGNNIFPPLIC